MYALRQIHEDLPDKISVPPALLHCRTEVIFIALDDKPEPPVESAQHRIMAFAGCWGNVGESTQVDLDAEIYSRRHAANRRRDDV